MNLKTIALLVAATTLVGPLDFAEAANRQVRQVGSASGKLGGSMSADMSLGAASQMGSASASATASQAADETPSMATPQMGVTSSGGTSKKTKRPQQQQVATLAGEDSDEAMARPQRRPRPSRKQQVEYVNDDGEEDCYEDDDGEGNFGGMFNVAPRPMRNFMNNMFRQMHQMAASAGNGDFQDYGGGASASAFSGGDGYSRGASFVNTNGRTRGIVSETRNGRTQTRRIGGDDSDEADEE